MLNTAELRAFYDGFIFQLATENERHRRIYKSLDTLPQGSALDLGCGAGLTSKRLADGGRIVTAVDFSPMAISHSKRHNPHCSITYICEDLNTFTTDDKFDSICMIDILEHLPPMTFWNILKIAKKASHDNTVIYVNVPNGKVLDFLRNNYPRVLQPIDISFTPGFLLSAFEKIAFVPFKMELYGTQYFEFFFCTEKRFNGLMNELYKSLNGSN